jgi:hypothetical protein
MAMSDKTAGTPLEMLLKEICGEMELSDTQVEYAKKLAAYFHKPTKDAINPDHYKRYPVECITLTEHMNFCLGNAVKYIYRAGEKDDIVQDLRKAVWYINREIERIQNGTSGTNGSTGGNQQPDTFGSSEWRSEGVELERPAAVRKLPEENVLRQDPEGAGAQGPGAGKGDTNTRSLGELLKERINELDSRDREGRGSAKRITITRRNR